MRIKYDGRKRPSLIGLRIKKMRLEKNLTCAAISKRCDMSQPNYSQIETGARIPDQATILRILNDGIGMHYSDAYVLSKIWLVEEVLSDCPDMYVDKILSEAHKLWKTRDVSLAEEKYLRKRRAIKMYPDPK